MAWRARICINSAAATAEFQKILDHNPLERKSALLSFAGARIKNYANQRNGDAMSK